MAIHTWPEGERPREKLIAQGAQTLSDSELLAIFLRVGVAGKSAVDLARELLEQFGGPAALFAASSEQLQRVKGIGAAKAAQLKAAFELARRALAQGLRDAPALSNPMAVREYLRLTLAAQPRECFHVVFLDAQHRALADETLFVGTLTQTSVYPREVVKAALARNAAAVILAHNHPGGTLAPSHADRELTRALKAALALVDVKVLDHFVVSASGAFSFAEHGILD